MRTYKCDGYRRAVDRFRSSYIPLVARLSPARDKRSLSRVLDYDRSELHGLVDRLAIGLDYSPTLDDSISYVADPIAQRVLREAIAANDFSLKKQTDRFKQLYVNTLARYCGVDAAAQKLKVSYRTVRDKVKRYKENHNNKLRFLDDRVLHGRN